MLSLLVVHVLVSVAGATFYFNALRIAIVGFVCTVASYSFLFIALCFCAPHI
jgi:hypothetical protein